MDSLQPVETVCVNPPVNDVDTDLNMDAGSCQDDESKNCCSNGCEDASRMTIGTLNSSDCIDWESFIDIEMRMVDDDEKLDLLSARLDQFHCQDESQDCHRPLMTLEQIKTLIKSHSKAAFNDIPGLPTQSYSDSELYLWSALISQYRTVATKVPKYTKLMIWSGIPPSLRGLAWMSMSEAYSQTYTSLYNSLAAEWTPFVKIIGRDLNRTFPEIGMFQQREGVGQMMLGKVLRAYSAYDMQVGYCQGLTFLTGPLLLHMSDCDAFCVLVKLMEDYDLRSMFTADMAGLKLRVYQFEQLLAIYIPKLDKHFRENNVTSIYSTQWFLSFFAVTCPLAMLVRIYDLLFAEGAVPTMMRVALGLLKRNESILLSFNDDEQILERLLGRSVWDVYNNDADLLLTDITCISDGLLSKISALESAYNSGERPRTKAGSFREVSLKLSGLTNKLPSLWSNSNVHLQTYGDGKLKTHKHKKPQHRPDMSRYGSKISVHSLSSDVTLARKDSGICSSSSSSSINSLSDSDESSTVNFLNPGGSSITATADELKDQLNDLKAQLSRTKLALDLERRERQVDRDLIDSVISRVDGQSNLSDEHFEAAISSLKDRMGIKGENIKGLKESNCKSCERLLMDLATARTNEAMARQELDELGDRLYQMDCQQTIRKSPSKWGIWT